MSQTLHPSVPRPKKSGAHHVERARTDAHSARNTPGLPLFLRGAKPMVFPHAETISAGTGLSVSGSVAVHDPAACEERRVPGFTDGSVTRFRSKSPALHVAAHEAAHQLQHAGRTSDGGLGAERHADRIANAITSGRSARSLFGTRGAPVAAAVRNYTTFDEAAQTASGQWKAGGTAYVGDEGRTVTTSADKHACYADPALITEANAILKTKHSGVNLEPGFGGLSGDAPDGSGFKSTVKVNYKILSDEDNEEFYADCGYSAREVMGGTGTDTAPKGIYRDAAGNRRETGRSKDPADFRDDIFVAGGLGTDRASAHAAYNALNDADKDAFDKKHGINKYAAPRVGEAFTRRNDDELGGTGFNFHWGSVIMVAGGDRVTFENYTKGKGYTARDAKWYFATYGPPTKLGQTWHERWKSVGGEGKGTTLAAATSADPSPFMKGAAAMSTANVIKRYKTTSDEAEKMAMEAEMRMRWIKVTVFVKEAQEGTDEVYARAESGGKSHETGEIDMGSGDTHTFWFSLDRFVPVTGLIRIGVYDSDVFSDDKISAIAFDDPYAPTVDNTPWDDAEYQTTVEFDR